MRTQRIATGVGLGLLDGLATAGVARLAYAWWLAAPWDLRRMTSEVLDRPLDPLDAVAFAAGALCAPLLLVALATVRAQGVRYAAVAAVCGVVYGLLAATMTGALLPLALTPDRRNPLALLGAILYGSAIGGPVGLAFSLIFGPVVLPAGALLGLLNGGVVRLACRAPR